MLKHSWTVLSNLDVAYSIKHGVHGILLCVSYFSGSLVRPAKEDSTNTSYSLTAQDTAQECCCYYYYYLLQLSFHSVAVVLTLVETKHIIYMNKIIQKQCKQYKQYKKCVNNQRDAQFL